MERSEEIEAKISNFDCKYGMLPFEKQIFMDLFEKDALLILAKGLNYNTILANFLWVHKHSSNLVLIINSNDYEERYFSEKFKLVALPTLGPEREKVYLEGGIHFISTRILVVDLLKNRIPIPHITGIIVLRAHTVLESCQEAFALRLYRQQNKTGYIKAMSNSPISFTFGYHQVEKVMRALFVTELLLWPRASAAYAARKVKVTQKSCMTQLFLCKSSKWEVSDLRRLGKKDNTKIRPILITLTLTWRKYELLRKNKDFPTGTYVTEDYPKEIIMKRKELKQRKEQEEKKGKTAFIRYDKIIVREREGSETKRKRSPSKSPNSIELSTNTNKGNSVPKKINKGYDTFRFRSSSTSGIPEKQNNVA